MGNAWTCDKCDKAVTEATKIMCYGKGCVKCDLCAGCVGEVFRGVRLVPFVPKQIFYQQPQQAQQVQPHFMQAKSAEELVR